MFSILSRVLNPEQIKAVYYAYVQSILQYGMICWGGTYSTTIQPLIITQKSILKAALKKPLRYSTNLLFQDFTVLDVRQLFIKVLLCHAIKNNFDFLWKSDYEYLTRHNINIGISIPRILNTISTKCSYYISHFIYGKIPVELRTLGSCSLAVYKRKLDQWLLATGREASAAMIVSNYLV